MLFTTNIHAQNALTTPNGYTFWNAEMQAIAKPESKPGWIYFKGDFSAAQNLLADIEYTTKPDYVYQSEEHKIRQELNQKALSTINEIGINLRQSKRTWLQLNESELDDIKLIKDGFTPAAKTAEQILKFYGVKPNPHPIKKFTPEYLAGLDKNSNTFNYQMQLSPNPANTQTQVSYVLPEWTKEAELTVTDQYHQMGSELYKTTIDIESIETLLDVSNYNTGVYIVNLWVNGEVVAGKQLLVIH